jgi:hypothetical protein
MTTECTRPRLFVLMIAAAICIWPRESAGQSVAPGSVRVGDRWTYESKDAATGDIRNVFTLLVAEITDKEITTRVSVRGKDRPRTVVFDPQWGIIDDGIVKYRPASLLGIRTPLNVGKEWRSETNVANSQTGNNFRASTVTRVVAAEQTTTAAGTFDTFRVEIDVVQVNSKDATKASKAKHVFWYAPAINRWVKKTFEIRIEGRLRDSTVDELTEYSRTP